MVQEELAIINGIKKGDKAAFECIYKEYYVSLCVFAARITGNQEEAEEIVQNIIITIWDKKDGINITKSLKSYLFQSVHNMALNYLRKKKLENNYMLSIAGKLHDLYLNHSEKIIYNELENIINDAINKLPEQTQKIFKQSRLEGLKYKEIAKNEGITVKGVEFHISKALQLLREDLKDYLYMLVLFCINLN